MTSVQEEVQAPTLFGQGKRWAVLVGINAYIDTNHFGTLHMSVGDAKKIREALIAGGFEQDKIHLLTDEEERKPNREEIMAELQAVASATDDDDLLLFYFSGHGIEKDGVSYLIPQNGKGIISDQNGVSMWEVKEIIEHANARAKVIILDACHSGADIPAKSSRRMSKAFIQNVFEQAMGMAILSSCTRGQSSYEWTEKQCSVFTYYLLEALQGQADSAGKGFVTVLDVNTYVTNGVKSWASLNQVIQTPTLNYLVSGDILLTTVPEQSDTHAITSTDEYVLSHVIDSARKYLIAIQTVVEESMAVFRRGQVWIADCQRLLLSFEQLEKPTFVQRLGTRSITDALLYPLSLSIFAIEDKKEKVSALISAFGQNGNATTRQIAARQIAIRDLLTTLVREIASANTLIDSIKKRPPNPAASKVIEMEQRDPLDKYVGDVKALGEMRVNEELTNQLVDMGIQPKKDAQVPREDILERFRRIPLHAIFLYTSEDQLVGDYIAQHWGALATLSGDACDIHPTLNQFKNAEDAYDYIEKLHVVQDAGFKSYSQLPGIFFHDNHGASEFVSFGKNVTPEEIKRTVRVVFEAIRSNPTIFAVTQARHILEDGSQQPAMSKENNPKRSGQWTDLLVILIVFVVVIAGFIAIAQFVSPVVLSIIILGALLFFVVIITWLLRRSNELSENNFVKIVFRTFDSLPLLRGQAPKDQQKDQEGK